MDKIEGKASNIFGSVLMDAGRVLGPRILSDLSLFAGSRIQKIMNTNPGSEVVFVF